MKRLILLALAGLLAATAAQAEIIYVQGDVSGVWSADTVMVTGEVRVPPGQTLVIQPGVKVLFQVYCKLIVDSAATLLAVGTQTDSILFDALADTAHWHGIRFLSASGSCRLEYCHLRDGQASGAGEDVNGGAIYCFSSSPIIQSCRIENCSALSTSMDIGSGGGIHITNNSNPVIANNIISGNSVAGEYWFLGQGGGISCVSYSDPIIVDNIITGNSIQCFIGQGGGIYCYTQSDPMISDNIIYGNSASHGGGIECYYASPTIRGNIIRSNSSSSNGGGIYIQYLNTPIIEENILSLNSGDGIHLSNSNPTITGNIIRMNNSSVGAGISCYETGGLISKNAITDNSTDLFGQGGGIWYAESSPAAHGNTLYQNSAYEGGGIFLSDDSGLRSVNGILWANFPQQILRIPGAVADVIYSNIQSGWPGLGNINAYPAFVDTALDDYRLLWGSPCIDSGHPDSLDPDGTRADMGAFYYDQSVMVRILLTPHEIPYLIPATGGSMDYTIRAFNRDSLAHAATVWCNVTLPDSSVYGPVLGPVTVTLGAGALLERVRTQNVPAAAPMGVYHYNAFAVVGSDTSSDSFMWGKLGSLAVGRWSLDNGEWTNTGEPITDVVNAGARSAAADAPTKYALHPCSPNPFNAETVLSYQLPVASYVSLQVYDVAGRVAETLVDGWREAGTHAVTFNAADLPSGMYFCRIQAGEFVAVQKLVLLK